MNKLLETHSHIAALAAHSLADQSSLANDPSSIYISRNGNEFGFATGYGWHEGGVQFTGTRTEWEKALTNTVNAHIAIIDRCHLNGYMFVGKSDSDFITRVVLVGVYVDDKGKRYTFDTHKKAIFPDRTFYYELMLDRVLDPNEQDDFLLVADKKTGLQLKPEEQGKFIAFRHDGNDLILYPTRPVSEGLAYATADHEHPIARLHKISDSEELSR